MGEQIGRVVRKRWPREHFFKIEETGIFLVVSSGLEKEKRKIQKQCP